MAIITATKYYSADTYFNGNVTFFSDVNFDTIRCRVGIITNLGTVNLNTTGVATISQVKISSGIVTAAQTSQTVTYFGDASSMTVNGTLLSTAITGIGAIVPSGVIVMWSGTIANIPTGWRLCDGTNNTPDLRNRFIVGAHSGAGIGTIGTSGPGFNAGTGALNANYTPGDTGGLTAHQLTIAELASHTHTVGSRDSTAGDGSAAGNQEFVGGTLGTPVTTSSRGSDNYHENRPPYYALAYIMKT